MAPVDVDNLPPVDVDKLPQEEAVALPHTETQVPTSALREAHRQPPQIMEVHSRLPPHHPAPFLHPPMSVAEEGGIGLSSLI